MIPKSEYGIDRLAQALAKRPKKRKATYKEGDAAEKVWINFQVDKKTKRELVKLCNTPSKLNLSKYLRYCVDKLLTIEGEKDKMVNILKSIPE